MEVSDSIYYRHYRITGHAIDRYIERIGGDAGNLIFDLKDCWVFDASQKGLKQKWRDRLARCEREGGYMLTNGAVVFLAKPDGQRHVIITTLLMSQ
ncbi:hypothetical protein VRT12_003333 [Citrobacter koseri]|nr:hypothetical protein [Citrobacter koseri]HEJ0063829.1 hypothetical protein [Citrobacter koseri]HEM8493530.1 hypothetical protein [Citrobacter koseri]